MTLLLMVRQLSYSQCARYICSNYIIKNYDIATTQADILIGFVPSEVIYLMFVYCYLQLITCGCYCACLVVGFDSAFVELRRFQVL